MHFDSNAIRRRMRLGLLPQQNPNLGRITIHSSDKYESLKSDAAERSLDLAFKQHGRINPRSEKTTTFAGGQERLKLKERKKMQILKFFEKQKKIRNEAVVC
jgi:hypothetical protein